ncbi:uncharacterized protein N7498_002996 [Penicillium cinerascens]|uniref:Uncharacterized protein n=1 Tax=Penicillium cinerascens TaxID=70096 RepID=A0A9W9TBQ9_9EURO|nr:uncharacterized protein N7498_002996 [Penicillium cinerascens]KAJ5216589.1 hypothetical protein N7498_002996 [Penicillium cinerascens]
MRLAIFFTIFLLIPTNLKPLVFRTPLSDSRPERRRCPKQKKVIVTDSSSTSASSASKDDMRSKEMPIEKKVVASKRTSRLTDKETDDGDETLVNTNRKMRAAMNRTRRRPAIKKKTVATTHRMKAVALAQAPDLPSVHGDRDIKPETSPIHNMPMERKTRPIPITQRLDDPEPSLEDAFDAIYFVEDMANTVREIVNRVDQKYRRHARSFFDKRFGKQIWKD